MRLEILCLALSLCARWAVSAEGTFTKVESGEIVNDFGGFSAFRWGDFRNNGRLDLVVANNANVYYQNSGNGNFTAIRGAHPALEEDYYVDPLIADYDNDGVLDLLVTSGVNAPSPGSLRLFRGEGDGTFSPVTAEVLSGQPGVFATGAWADYDRDGLIDFAVAELSNDRMMLFRNREDGGFARIQGIAPVTIANQGKPVWADYNSDGFDDLLLLTGLPNSSNILYRNNRDGTFTGATNSVSSDRWTGEAECAAWGDFNNDLLLDVFVTTLRGTPNRLYANKGDGAFNSIGTGLFATRPANSDSKACAWGDYDNDGHLDLFISSYNGANQLFHNEGNGLFTAVTNVAPVLEDNTGIWANAAGWADYDNDGFLDLFVTRAGFELQSNLLFHNDGGTNT